MSNNLRPSLRDFLMTNLILHKCAEDTENPKYFLRLLNLSKICKNKPLNRESNKNKDLIMNKNLFLNNKSEKEKKIQSKMNHDDIYKSKNYIEKISKNYPYLYPFSKLNIKKSIRYIYDNNNYYKKNKDSNKDNLAKHILYVEKYDENRNIDNFTKSFSFIISKYKSEKKTRNFNKRNEYLQTKSVTENEKNSNKIENKEQDDDLEKIKEKIDENIQKLNGSKVNKSQSLSERYNNIKDNTNNKEKKNDIFSKKCNIEKEKISLDFPKKNFESLKNNKIELKFLFKKEENDKNIPQNKKDKNDLVLKKDNSKNKMNLKIADYEYKYDKNLELKMKPRNLIKTFQLNKYKIKNNINNINNNNKNYYSNKIIPIKLPQMAEITHFLVKYSNKEMINEKFLSNKYIEYTLLNKNTINSNEKYYYKINKMYAKQLKEYMMHRINWIYADKNFINNNPEPITINFQWKYYSNRLNFKDYKYEVNTPIKKLRMVNVFEKNAEIGNKKNMFINILSYCDKININAFDLIPLTIIVSNSKEIDNCLEALRELIIFVENKKELNKNLITNRKYNEHFWFDKNYENIDKQYININKNFLSDKNYWIIKPTDLYQGKCIEISNDYDEIEKKCKNIFRGVDKRIMPELLINPEEEDSEDENGQINNTINNNSGSDIEFKSEPNNNQNSIIEINNSNNNLSVNNNTNVNNTFSSTNKKSPNNSINKKKKIYSRMYCSNEIIIQKYLDNPLLYQKRKFDIRCFVLVDSNLNVYFCKEGHLKSSSKFYDLNSNDKFIHITNHSLQKKCSKFAQYEYGNEMSYDDFKKVMKEDNIPLEKFDKMIEEMKYLIKISFKAVGNKLLKNNPVLCFEIFGYDFILDNDFKPWILEINNNPGLGISSPVILKLVPRMLDDAFRLTIDKIFETKYSSECIDENGKYKSLYKLDGFTDEENIFEFLCNVK